MNWKGKTAVVTGGGTGIGRSICLKFAERGVNVVVCNSRNMEAANKVAAECEALGTKAIALQIDVTVAADCQRMIDESVKAFGRVDILCNNAGMIRAIGPLETLSEEDWDDNFAVNTKGVFLCSRAAIPQMRKQGYGRIINTASQCAKTGMPNFGHYCAAKAAVLLFTQTLALELAKTNIHVNAICPGSVDTEMTDRECEIMTKQSGGDPQALKASFVHGVPIGRFATPEDIAGVVLFLASDDADYITGENINVTGAQEMH